VLLADLAKAGRDDRIAAVVLRVRSLDIGWAKAQEIRDAIARLDAGGRRTIAYLELEGMGSNLEYYVASAAGELYANPASRAPLIGLSGEFFFFGGLFEKLGIDIEVERVGRYKTAADTFAGKEMSEAHREMANALLDSLDAQFVAGIAEARGLPAEKVREAIEQAPSDPADLVGFGLIDGVEGYDAVLAQAGGGPRVAQEVWRAVAPSSVGITPSVRFALVYASGNLVSGESGPTPMGGARLGAATLSEALAHAALDPEVAAIVLRIDSPGGSVLASEQVWSAVGKARESGKPVIASFSDVAASGGYYLAASADAIVASPASITGSIGVLVVRPVFAKLLEEFDVGVATLTRGARADLTLASKPLSPASRAWLKREVDAAYELFVKRVADGRPLDAPGVDLVGRGRVFTGAEAAELGLVDALGGLRTAVAVALERLGLDPDTDVALVPYPPSRPLAEQLAEALTQGRVRAGLPLAWAGVPGRFEPWLDAASERSPVALLPFALEIR
jgi:protease-4